VPSHSSRLVPLLLGAPGSQWLDQGGAGATLRCGAQTAEIHGKVTTLTSSDRDTRVPLAAGLGRPVEAER